MEALQYASHSEPVPPNIKNLMFSVKYARWRPIVHFTNDCPTETSIVWRCWQNTSELALQITLTRECFKWHSPVNNYKQVNKHNKKINKQNDRKQRTVDGRHAASVNEAKWAYLSEKSGQWTNKVNHNKLKPTSKRKCGYHKYLKCAIPWHADVCRHIWMSYPGFCFCP